MKRMLRVISATLAAVMVMSVYVTPAAASQGSDRGKRDTAKQDIYYLDAKIKVVDGQPALKVKTDKGYTSYAFPWPEVALVDGREEALKRQGNYYLLPTKDGYEKVHIEDFEVAFVAGQIALIAEVNPWWKVKPAVATAALVKAGIPVTWANMTAAAILIAAGKAVTLGNVTLVKVAKAAITAIFAVLKWRGEITATWRWVRGICIRPGCGIRTPGGSFGDVFCTGCARRHGQRIIR